MKKIISLFIVTALFLQTVTTQEIEENIEENNIVTSQETDVTFDTEKALDVSTKTGWLHENDEKKHPFVALGEVFFWNATLLSYNRFVCNAPWAKVGYDEWHKFWEREMKWDRDWYWTNFVLHPYQGSLYYMASRGSNLNPLESFGLTVFGSAMWEFFCEKNAPSINDMVYTTIGAFSVGEMLYRLSLEADEISQILGLVVNPTRLWTQLWTRQKPLGTTGNIHELSLRFSVGNSVGHTNIINYKGDYDGTEVYPVFFSPELYIEYKDPYGHDSNTPYSQFEFLFGGGIGKGSGKGSVCNFEELDKKLYYDIRVLTNGMMFSRALDLGENKETSIGMVMEYDFDWHSYYLLSSLAPGFAIKQRINFDSSKIEWQAHLAGIVLGTSDFYYYRRELSGYESENRDGTSAPYNYNIGAETKLSIKYKTDKGSSIGFNFRGYAMYDFYNQLQWLSNGEHGTQVGWDFVGVGNLSAELAVSKLVRLGISDEVYSKYATYKHIDSVFQIVNTASVYAKLQLK